MRGKYLASEGYGNFIFSANTWAMMDENGQLNRINGFFKKRIKDDYQKSVTDNYSKKNKQFKKKVFAFKKIE